MKRIAILLIVVIAVLAACTEQSRRSVQQEVVKAVKEEVPEKLIYGFKEEAWHIVEGMIRPGDVLSKVLVPLGVSHGELSRLVEKSRPVFDVRNIRPNRKWVSLYQSDTAAAPSFFIYEKNVRDYVVFALQDSLAVWEGSKPVEKHLRLSSGTVTSSLYEALQDAGAPTELALDMSSIYAWTIDFYRLQKNDAFEVLYEEEMVDGEPTGKREILYTEFKHNGTPRKAYFFGNDSTYGYFDREGESLRKAFLKAPVKYSRISSRYTKRRFHPVLKRYKAHLGTDYAAPHGTPIVAVGDGTVIKSSYTSGNGKYVKIRHNGTYTTQYLHMSRRAVNAGDQVRQGDVIGYVGSTGLATGPHVCFRFWKNGQQVDPFSEEFPPSDPIGEAEMPAFLKEVERLESLKDSIDVQPQPAVAAADSARAV